MGASKATSSTTSHPTLETFTKQISQATIRRKWKPLPASSQEKVREILLNLRTKRSGAGGGGNLRLPPIGKARSRAGNGRVTKSAVAEKEYEKVVEDVAEKLLTRLPRMPFPPSTTSSSTSKSTTAPNDFDHAQSLQRTTTLQTTITTMNHATRLLRRQIQREKAALKRDRQEVNMLEEGLRGAKEVRKRKERGMHGIVRVGFRGENWEGSEGEGDDEGGEGSEEEREDEDEQHGEQVAKRNETRTARKHKEIESINGIAGITLTSTLSQPSLTFHLTTSDVPPQDEDPFGPLLATLQTHLLSLRNNTASMQPILSSLASSQLAMEKFASRRMDEAALGRFYRGGRMKI